MEAAAHQEVSRLSDTDYSSDGQLDALELEHLWSDVTTVHTQARNCSSFTQDENAWSDEVVRPVLRWGKGSRGEFFDVVNV